MASRSGMPVSAKPKASRRGSAQAFLAVLVLGLAAYGLMASPLFSVSRVDVVGTTHLSSQEVVLLSRVVSSDNIFRLRLGQVRQGVLRSPRVKSVRVRRVLPSTVRIELVERRGVALVPYADYYLELDGDGVPIAIVDDMSNSRLPVITGKRPLGARLGTRVADDDLVDVVYACSTLDDSELASLSEVGASKVNDLSLYTTDGVRIRWGAAVETSGKAAVLRSILASIGDGQLTAKYVDISVPKLPVVAGVVPSR